MSFNVRDVYDLTPLQQGSYPVSMGIAGYHPSIGMLPEWDVLYLTCSAPSLWRAIQRNAYSAGRFGIHYRDEATNRPVRVLDYPRLTLYGTDSIGDVSTSTTGTYPPTPAGGRRGQTLTPTMPAAISPTIPMALARSSITPMPPTASF